MIKFLGRAYLGIFLIIISRSLLVAQHPNGKLVEFEQITIAEGLSQNTVTTILQDTKGFLWLGTLDGLNRFDGLNFKHFTNKKKDSSSIANSSIHTLYKDHRGTLWVGTEEGLSMYNNSTETFINYFTQKPIKVYSIYEFENNHSGLWLGTSGGLYYFDLKSKELELIQVTLESEESEKIEIAHNEFFDTNPKSINAVESINANILLLGTGSKGLVLYDITSGEINTVFQGGSGKMGLISNYIFDIQKHPDGSFWIATGKGISCYQPESQTFFNYPTNEVALNIFIDSKNRIWCGTEGNGLFVFNKKRKLTNHFSKDHKNPKSLGDNGVYDVFETDDGNIWVGTYNNGVNKYDPSKRKFHQFNLSDDPLMELSDQSLRKIIEYEKGNLWVSTVNSGLNKIDFSKGKVDRISHSEEKDNILSSNRLNALAEDENGNIWIGFANDGINILSEGKGSKYDIQLFQPRGGDLPSPEIMDIKVDSAGSIWLGTYGGLAKFNAKTNEYKTFIPNAQITESAENKIRVLEVTDPSNVWMGTQGGGLLKFNVNTEEFEFFRSDKNNENSLSSNFINSILLDKEGILWVGTKKGGLNRFDPDKEAFKSFTEEDGLSNNYIYGILEDDHQNLWISTNKGISKNMFRN